MPTLPLHRDDLERIAHDALDAARHPVRTARATVDAARHPVRTAQAAAGQLRTAVTAVAGRVTEGSPGDTGTTPPTDTALAPSDVAVEVTAGPAPAHEIVPVAADSAQAAAAAALAGEEGAPVSARSADDAVGEIVADSDGADGDEIAPGLEMPLTPRPHLSPDVELEIAGELDPDPEPRARPRPDSEPLTDPGTARAIRREAERGARASDPASRRD